MMELDIRRDPEGGLKRMQEEFPNIGNRIVGAIGSAYAKELRRTVFSGQVFQKITGETKKSVRHYKLEKGIWAVRPGKGIKGRLNYLYRFERGERPFMKPSWQRFQGTGQPKKVMQWVYDKAQQEAVNKK
jgi:hypothetical protein